MGGEKKEGKENTDFKNGGQAGSRGDASKRWAQNPRTYYALVCS